MPLAIRKAKINALTLFIIKKFKLGSHRFFGTGITDDGTVNKSDDPVAVLGIFFRMGDLNNCHAILIQLFEYIHDIISLF